MPTCLFQCKVGLGYKQSYLILKNPALKFRSVLKFSARMFCRIPSLIFPDHLSPKRWDFTYESFIQCETCISWQPAVMVPHSIKNSICQALLIFWKFSCLSCHSTLLLSGALCWNGAGWIFPFPTGTFVSPQPAQWGYILLYCYILLYWSVPTKSLAQNQEALCRG